MQSPSVLTYCLLFVMITLGPFLVFKIAPRIARPLDSAAKNRKHLLQFTIVDFLCLFFLVQAPTGLIHMMIGAKGVDQKIPYFLDGCVWLAVGLVWWKCVEIMSRAGINRPWHRVVLLVFVLPTTVVGPLLPVIFPIVVSVGMVEFSSIYSLIFTALVILAGITASVFLSAHLVRQIVADSESVAEVPVEIVEEEPEGPNS